MTNLSTSRLIDDVATELGSTVHRSAVGEANVAQLMLERGASIGGEGNGGVMLPAVTWVRDSLSAMALVLDLLAHEDRSLSEIVDAMPRHAMIKQAIELAGEGASARLLRGMESVTAEYEGRPGAVIQDSDGVRVDLPGGWFHLRPSNTEPIARLIVECGDEPLAEAMAAEVREIAGL